MAETWLQNVRDICLHHKIFWMPLSLHRKVKLRQEVSKGRRNRPNVPGREGSPVGATRSRNQGPKH